MPITTSSFLHFSNKKVRKSKKEHVTNQQLFLFSLLFICNFRKSFVFFFFFHFCNLLHVFTNYNRNLCRKPGGYHDAHDLVKIADGI